MPCLNGDSSGGIHTDLYDYYFSQCTVGLRIFPLEKPRVSTDFSEQEFQNVRTTEGKWVLKFPKNLCERGKRLFGGSFLFDLFFARTKKRSFKSLVKKVVLLETWTFFTSPHYPLSAGREGVTCFIPLNYPLRLRRGCPNEMRAGEVYYKATRL